MPRIQKDRETVSVPKRMRWDYDFEELKAGESKTVMAVEGEDAEKVISRARTAAVKFFTRNGYKYTTEVLKNKKGTTLGLRIWRLS